MRFSAVNILLLSVATVVSAIPIAQFTSSLDLESRDDFDVPDMFEREFDEPALYRRAGSTKYLVGVAQTRVDGQAEHWALHFYPAPENKQKSAPWHKVHAAATQGMGGILQTKHQELDDYDKIQQPEGQRHMVLGSFDSHADAKKAAESVAEVKCTLPFPSHNCVDWTKNAVRKLHNDGHVDDEHLNAFNDHYHARADAVRKKTFTAANVAKTL